MPRRAREKSKSGIYHIILRGANRQEIFHDDEDNLRFTETLERFKKVSNMMIYGWCLMGNHVHLLLGQGKEELSVTIKRIGVSYSWYYNWKYKSTGHLFQDRYRSESVENDEYFLIVIRYIHQNPVKAGIVNKVTDWKWSSCRGYYGEKDYLSSLIDSELILGMFSENMEEAITRFKEYNKAANEDQCLDDQINVRLTDQEARHEIIKLILPGEIATIKSMPKARRDEIILKIKQIEGITQRQISRILGVAPNLIFRTKE